MKKLLIGLSLVLCVSCLAACAKKDEPNSTEFAPNYAINETKDKSEEPEYNYDENGDPIYTEQNIIVETEPIFENDTNNSTVSNNKTFTYPTSTENGYYIDLFRVAETMPFGFILNGVSANLTDGKDIITEASITNKVFSQGYHTSLKLVDTDIMSTKDQTLCRLSLFEPAVEHITIGQYQYEFDELLYNANDFENMIKTYTSKYSVCIPVDFEGNEIIYTLDDIYSYAECSDGLYGKTYTWTYEWTTDNEYTDEDASIIINTYGELPKNYIIITAECDDKNELVYYTLKIKKAAHFWVKEIVYVDTVTELVENEDGTVSENTIEEIETRTGKYNCSQDGYYFDDAYIKLIDGSYIGLNNFEITIHNTNSMFNKSLTFDYVLD